MNKFKKIIFGFLIVFSFFQVCSYSFAKDVKKENKNATVVKDKKIPSPLSLQLVDSKIEEANNRTTSIEKKPNFSLDNMPLIISILSLLMNFIFIKLYFIGDKNVFSKINKLSSKIKNQNDINIGNFVNINKYIVAFEKTFENIHTEINHINKDINYIQNSILEVGIKKRDKSLRDLIIKDNNHYQEKKIKTVCDNHFEMLNREFMKEYAEGLKTIEILDGLEKGFPIFKTSSTGKYLAVKVVNSSYIVFYSKGTNITSENHSLFSVFTLAQIIEKDKIYSNWKIIEPAIFFLHDDDTWSMQEKGIINLDEKKETINSIIENDTNIKIKVKETQEKYAQKTEEIIDIAKNRDKSLRDEIKKPISHIKNLCNKHAEMPSREFIKNYPNAIKLDITNQEDVVYRNNDPIFQETDQGKYIAIALPELENSNHYLFYGKGTNITSEDIALKTVFSFDKEYEKSQIYSDWKILEPAILNMNNNNWQIFKKGKIEL